MVQEAGSLAEHAGGHAGGAAGEHESGHPGELTYIKVAAVLVAITVAEVAIWYTSINRTLLVAMLLCLSAVKFATVVGFFMHLKFDDRRLTWIFSSGLIVAFSIIMALYALFHYHPIQYATKLF